MLSEALPKVRREQNALQSRDGDGWWWMSQDKEARTSNDAPWASDGGGEKVGWMENDRAEEIFKE